jgi:hypothetical protein
MENYAQLAALLDLADEVGLTVRVMPSVDAMGDHPGGALVRMKGRDVLFLDGSASVADRLDVTAAALAGRPELAGRFIVPELRELIDKNRMSGT